MPISPVAQPYVTILAPSFQGATTIAALLNNHPKLVSLGDTNPPRIFEHHECTCGAEIRSCPFWVALRANLAAFQDPVTPGWFPMRPRFVGGKTRVDSYVATAAAALDGGGVLRRTLGRLPPYQTFRAFIEQFADFVRAASGKPIYVDGEKSLTKYLASRVSGLEPRAVIHVIRDPRAFVASSKRVGVPLERAASEWRQYHSRALRLARQTSGMAVMRLRYEDFSSDPKASVSAMLRLIGVEDADVFFRPAPGDFWHQTGNRTILKFNGDVRESDRWRSELTDAEAARVLVLSGPLAKTYGYR
jgi:hypothetical protein